LLRRCAISAGAALVLLLPAPASAEPQLVIKVKGPLAKRIRTGTFLGDGTAIKLGKYDHIVVVDSKGARAFTGPKQISLGRTPLTPGGGTRIANGMVGEGKPIVHLAGVRGIEHHPKGAISRQINPYLRTMIHPGADQPVCFLQTAVLMLERNGSDAETLTLEPLARGTAVMMRFAAFQKQLAWPATHRPNVAAQYRIKGKSRSHAVTLIPVPAGVTGWLELGMFLNQQKCSNGDWVLAQRDWDVRTLAAR
jgi:hypothetical protein